MKVFKKFDVIKLNISKDFWKIRFFTFFVKKVSALPN